MKNYVYDDKVLITLIGLRFVTKRDITYVSSGNKYYLEFAYKGQERSIDYGNDKKARDAMYKKVVEGIRDK